MQEKIEADSKIAFETEAYQKSINVYESNMLRWRDADKAVGSAAKAVKDLEKALINLTTGETVTDPSAEYRAAQAHFTAVSNDFAKAGHDLDILNVRIESLQSRIADADERKARYEKDVKSIKMLQKEIVDYTTTSAELAKFKTEMVSGVIPTLSERASELITQITEGKYSELSLTPAYDIQYRNDQGDFKSFPNLSGGEQDAFALAMRLAIADLRASRIGVLVLDEVFESLDSDRQEATWQALEKLSTRFSQVFLVTHVASFKDRAPYTINL
jgi:exonuclease SbcC